MERARGGELMNRTAELLKEDTREALKLSRENQTGVKGASEETMLPKKAAALLNISYWLILELAKRKQIPHVRIGGRVLFRRDSLIKWLDEQEKASVAKDVDEKYGQIRRIHG